MVARRYHLFFSMVLRYLFAQLAVKKSILEMLQTSIKGWNIPRKIFLTNSRISDRASYRISYTHASPFAEHQHSPVCKGHPFCSQSGKPRCEKEVDSAGLFRELKIV